MTPGNSVPIPSAGAVTGLLLKWRQGDAEALARLLPLVYDELRQIAARQLQRERADHTLQPTAIVHETFLKLVDLPRLQWQDRAHFLAVASRLMRQVLVDYARARHTLKRGGSQPPREQAEPAEQAVAIEGGQVDVLALDSALERLAAFDSEQARLVELRFFGGLTIAETADVLRSSPATVKRDWDTARTWLFRELGGV